MKMLKVKTMFKFLEKKVPLWGLLFAGIFIIAESAQIMTELGFVLSIESIGLKKNPKSRRIGIM